MPGGAGFRAPRVPGPGEGIRRRPGGQGAGNNRAIVGFGKQALAAAGGVIALDTAVRQLNKSISKSIQLESGQQRIKALAEGFDDYKTVLDVAARSADKFNLSQIESEKQIGLLFGRLRPLGLSLAEIETVSTDSTPQQRWQDNWR